jgi:23S rRNA (guanine2445-N2)-methyltransferase / 23S rRNA (guanine2069-N7)-methyltransferase
MKETLAAALLTWAGWPRIARDGGAFVDFMCGSATLPIEAAMMAGDIAPGLLRRRWGFSRWLQHDAQAWESLLDETQNRRADGIECMPPVSASDTCAKSIDIARRSLRRVERADSVALTVCDLESVRPLKNRTGGLIALNPPYGKRMLETGQLPTLYRHLHNSLQAHWKGYRLALITSDRTVSDYLELKPQHSYPVRNGAIEAEILTYHI